MFVDSEHFGPCHPSIHFMYHVHSVNLKPIPRDSGHKLRCQPITGHRLWTEMVISLQSISWQWKPPR